jgi:hypothetical protein
MENETQNFARPSDANAPQDVAKLLAKQVAVPLFEAALIRLGRAGSHGEVVTLFNDRASYTAIQDWRRGRRPVPQWAWDYLGLLLDQNMADDASVRERVRKPPLVAQGRGAHNNIAKFNQRRFANAPNKKAGG